MRISPARRLAALVLPALLLCGSVQAQAPGVNDPAPDFTLQQLDGDSQTLSAYRGKVTLLVFFGFN